MCPANHLGVCAVRKCTTLTPFSSTATNLEVLGFSPSASALDYGKTSSVIVKPAEGYIFTASPLVATELVSTSCGLSGSSLQLMATFPGVTAKTCSKDAPVLMTKNAVCKTSTRTLAFKGSSVAVSVAECAALVSADSACSKIFVHRFGSLPDTDNCKYVDASSPDVMCVSTLTSTHSNVWAVSPDSILGKSFTRENPDSQPADGASLGASNAASYNCTSGSFSASLECTGAKDLNAADDSTPLSGAFYSLSARVACPGGTDECTAGSDNCDPNAICIDTDSAFSCECNNALGFYDTNYETRQAQGGGRSCAVPSCGDGIWAETEACEDGNRVRGDGCSALCEIENGWACAAWGSGGSSGCTRACAETRGASLPSGFSFCDSAGPNPAISSLVLCTENCAPTATTFVSRMGCPFSMQQYLTATSRTDPNLVPSTFASSYTCETVSPPRPTANGGAVFLSSVLRKVYVLFDADVAVHLAAFTTVSSSLSTDAMVTAILDPSAVRACTAASSLFESDTEELFGGGALCRWTSLRRLEITLGTEPEPPDRLLIPEDVVKFSAGSLQRLDAFKDVPSSIYGVRFTHGSVIGAEVEFPAGTDSSTFTPSISIRGPAQVSRCQPLILQVNVADVGLGGRTPQKIVWSLTCTNTAGGATIACRDILTDAVMDSSGVEGSLTLSVTSEAMRLVETHLSGLSVTSANLAFQVTLTNALGLSSNAAALTVTFDTTGITPRIRRGSDATINAAVIESISLSVDVGMPEAIEGCSLTADQQAITVRWTAQMTAPSSSDISTVLNATDLSPPFKSLTIPPGFLLENAAVTVTAEAFFTAAPGSPVSVTFTVNTGTFAPLTSEITTLASPSPSASCPIILSAASTTNPNKEKLADLYPSYFTAGNLTFSWGCQHKTVNASTVPPTTTLSPCSAAAQTAVLTAKENILLPSGALTAGEQYVFTVNARASVSHATMSLNSASTISASVSKSFTLHPVASIASAAAFTVSVISISSSSMGTETTGGMTFSTSSISSGNSARVSVTITSPSSSSGSCKPSIEPVLEVYRVLTERLSVIELDAAVEDDFPYLLEEGGLELESEGIALTVTEVPYGAPEAPEDFEVSYYEAAVPASLLSGLEDEYIVLAVDLQESITTAREAVSMEFSLEQTGWASESSTLSYAFELQEVTLNVFSRAYVDVAGGLTVLQGFQTGIESQWIETILPAGRSSSFFQVIAKARDEMGGVGSVRSSAIEVSKASPPSIATLTATANLRQNSAQAYQPEQLLTFLTASMSVVDVSSDSNSETFTESAATEMKDYADSVLTILESAVF
uniref:EGF-like domain-containing protein n=1 Tax=Chromera velia CCMP2878 TaxID=1169474 RepID=A0A0G4H8D2_9ALVE|eukprot:Cvel_25121.t1-p1 / transcript=Cvel_25121.t1 / gene=Cvel_25121 / organism=Chromera_velia_CCMP2878 / gene_product=hypothetical protein / transcript_product=hypothetical protein / location=Cvel_scaffold2804:18354-23854(-) / protein_length=1312 / sequence_SO=supercontig / SO=protein_coding / is_pseudo=false